MTARQLAHVLPLALVLCVATPSFAQDDPPPDKRAQVEERVKQIRSRVLRDEVGLSEAKAKKVEAIMDEHQAERTKLRTKQRQHRQALRQLLDKDSDDQKAYERELKGLRDTQKKLQALREKEIDELQKVLTPKEQAKLGAAMEKMKRRVKQAVQRHRKSPPRGR